MLWLAKKALGFLTGGFLDKAFATVDKHIEATTDREKIKAGIVETHLRSRPGFMQAGGFWLMLIFALPLGFWFASVCVYSVFWCADCAYPQGWTIAALPAPIDEWSGMIIVSIFGVVGLARFAKK